MISGGLLELDSHNIKTVLNPGYLYEFTFEIFADGAERRLDSGETEGALTEASELCSSVPCLQLHKSKRFV